MKVPEWESRSLLFILTFALLLPKEVSPPHPQMLKPSAQRASEWWENYPTYRHLRLQQFTKKCQSLSSVWLFVTPMDFSPPGSSVHRILQTRILEWVANSLFQGIFPTQRLNPCLLHCRQILYRLSYEASPDISAVANFKCLSAKSDIWALSENSFSFFLCMDHTSLFLYIFLLSLSLFSLFLFLCENWTL